MKSLFLDTVNQIVFWVILLVVALTLDWILLIIGVLSEIGYLIVFSRMKKARDWYNERGKRINENLKEIGEEKVDPLDRALLVVSICGMVVIFFFGFGKHLLSRIFPYLSHAAGWEVGALIWTLLFIVYYAFKTRLTGTFLDKLVVFVICFFGIASIVLAYLTLHSPMLHMFFIFLISLCLCTTDGLLLRHYKKDIELKSSKMEANALKIYMREKELSKASFRWADIPMAVAFGILLLYLWAHGDTESKQVFVSGVVAFQLLISNVLFIVLEFGFLRLPAAAEDKAE